MESGAYAFISYSSKNQTMADAVRRLLMECGILCWMAPYDIPAGSKYAYVINDALENCGCLLLLLTNDSQASQFVEREVERAITYRKPIITMQLEDVVLNSGFKFYLGYEQIIAVHDIDANNPEMQKIINGVRAFVGTSRSGDETREKPAEEQKDNKDSEKSHLIAAGIVNKDISWQLDSDGCLNISGEGKMPKCDWLTSSLWGHYVDFIEKIYISQGILSIGEYAFSGCKSLKSITIPDSVTSIGWDAFRDCRNLKSITIPHSVTSIDGCAFWGCSSMESIMIPDSVTLIQLSVFEECSSLKSIIIPDSITSIGSNAFWCCSSLESITIPDSVTSIGESAFAESYNLKSVTIPNSVTSIENSVFSGCDSLESITIPDGVTSIGDSTFAVCISLKSIAIPDSVTSIGNGAFEGCSSLKNIIIPSGVTSIEDNTFSNCSSLESIEIPDSVTSIGDGAFKGCHSLKKVVLPRGVKVRRKAFDRGTKIEYR